MVRSRPELILCFCVFVYLLLYFPIYAGIVIIFCICVAVIKKRSDWFDSGGPNTPSAAAALSRVKKQARWRVSAGSSTSLNHLHRIVSNATPSPARQTATVSGFNPNLSPFTSSGSRSFGGPIHNLTPRSSPNVTPRLAFECINYNSNHPLNKSPRMSPKFTSTPTSCMVNSGGRLPVPHVAEVTSGVGGQSAHRQKGTYYGDKRSPIESDTKSPYGVICQSRYSGAGIYPMVNLSPIPPTLLSPSSHGSQTKSKLHYKLPHSEMLNAAKFRLGREVVGNAPQGPPQSNNIHTLSGRTLKKRPNKDLPTGNDAISKRQRADMPYLGEPLRSGPGSMISDGLIPYFDEQMMESASCLFSPRPMPTVPAVRTATSPIPNASKTVSFKRQSCSAIESSYSSSKRMMDKNITSVKRKCEEPSSAASLSKRINMNLPNSPPLSLPMPKTVTPSLLETDVITSNLTPSPRLSLPPEDMASSEEEETHKLGAVDKQSNLRSRYFPTFDDYIADRKTDEERLKTILSFLSPRRNESADGTDTQCNGAAPRPGEGTIVMLKPAPFDILSTNSGPPVSSTEPLGGIGTTSASISFGPTPTSVSTFTSTTTNSLLASNDLSPPSTNLQPVSKTPLSTSNNLQPLSNPLLTSNPVLAINPLLSPNRLLSPNSSLPNTTFKLPCNSSSVPSTGGNPAINSSSIGSTTVSITENAPKIVATVAAQAATLPGQGQVSATPFTVPAVSTSLFSSLKTTSSSNGALFSFGGTPTTTTGLSKLPSISSVFGTSASKTTITVSSSVAAACQSTASTVTTSIQTSLGTPNFSAAFGQRQPLNLAPTTTISALGASSRLAAGLNATSQAGATFLPFASNPPTTTSSLLNSGVNNNNSVSFGSANICGIGQNMVPKSIFGPGALATVPNSMTTLGQPQQSSTSFGSTVTGATAFTNQFRSPQPSTVFNLGSGLQNLVAATTSSSLVTAPSSVASNSIFNANQSKSGVSSVFDMPKSSVNAFGATSFGNTSHAVTSPFGGISNSTFAGNGAAFGTQAGTAFGGMGTNKFGGAAVGSSFSGTGNVSFGATSKVATIASNSPAFGAASQSNVMSMSNFIGGASAFPTSTTAATSGFSGAASVVNKMTTFSGGAQAMNGTSGGSPFVFGGASQQPSSVGGGFNFGGQTTNGASGFQFGGVQPSASVNLSSNTLTVASNNYSNNNNNFATGGQVASPFAPPSSQGFAFNPSSPPSFNFGSGLPVSNPTAGNASLFSMGSGATPSSRRTNRTLTSRSRHR